MAVYIEMEIACSETGRDYQINYSYGYCRKLAHGGGKLEMLLDFGRKLLQIRPV